MKTSNFQENFNCYPTPQGTNNHQYLSPSKQSQSHNPEIRIESIINQVDKEQNQSLEGSKKMQNQEDTNCQQPNGSTNELRTYQKLSNNKHTNCLTQSQKALANQQHNSDDGEAEENGYHDLTLKLEKALNKIQMKKTLTKCASQPATVWQRFEQCAQRSKKQMQKKKEENERERVKEIKCRPTINKKSEDILRETGYEPIHLRFEKLVEAKKRKQQDHEECKKQGEKLQEALYLEELNKHLKRPQNMRTYDQYFSGMVKWKEQRQTKNKQKFQQKQSKQLQSLTFSPVLNEKSKKLVSSQTRLPIDQRGLVKKKMKPEFSFTPNLTKPRYK